MANKQKGNVSVSLDKVRTLRYTLNALGEIEDRLGVSIQDMGDIKMTIKNLRTLLWAGLMHEDKELTELQVGDMVDVKNLQDVQKKVVEAFAMREDGKNE